MAADPREVTRLLLDWSAGNKAALDQLTPLIYHDLRRTAAGYLSRERRNSTLQPTALIHEVYLRLIDQTVLPGWESRAQFFGIAARIMRQVLVDLARRKLAGKRGGDAQRVPLEDAKLSSSGKPVWMLDLDLALERLRELDERKMRAIELRYFGGLEVTEVARTLEISEATARRDLRMAEAWLGRQLAASPTQ